MFIYRNNGDVKYSRKRRVDELAKCGTLYKLRFCGYVCPAFTKKYIVERSQSDITYQVGTKMCIIIIC